MREKGFLILLMAGVLMGWAVDALGEPVSQDNPQIIPEAPPVSTDALEVVLVEQIAVDGQVTGYTVWYEDGSGMSFPADPPPISGNPSSGAVVGAGPTGAIGAVSAVVSPPDDTTADEPPQPAEPPVTLPPTEEQAGSATAPPAVN